jgi:hypothetical protein
MCDPDPICCTALASVFGTLPTRILRGTILTCFCLVLAQVAAIPEPLGEYRPDRILIKPRTAADLEALSEVHAQVGARVLRQFEWLDDIQVVELPEPETVLEWIKHYEESGLVDFSEPDYLLTVAAIPSDPYYSNGSLWHLHNTGQNVRIGTAGSAPNRKLVIAWVDVPYAANPPANFTFQVVLEEGTHQIQFHYQSVASGRGPGDQGKSATVGLENASGTVAARYSYNGSTLLSAWEGIYTATAGATGQIEFLDTTPSDTAPRFYRAVAVP